MRKRNDHKGGNNVTLLARDYENRSFRSEDPI